MTVSILSLGLWENFYFWLVLRLVNGFAIVGLYLVIESWLNSEVSNKDRGSVLATYTVIILSGLAVGQLLLNTTAVDGFQILMFASILITLAAVPVCLTSSSQPTPIPNATFSPLLVLKTSRAAALGALTAGLVSGSIYGLGGIYGSQVGLDVESISIMMALSIAGGALAQLPLGKLSDRFDRRLIILGCVSAGAVISAIAVFTPNSLVYAVMFFFGASVMSLQALSLALASDNASGGNFMEVGTGLLMTNAAGSAIGPLLTSLLMYRYGPEFFFISHFAVLSFAAVTVLILIKTKPAASEHPSNFVLATSASAQAVFQLDVRADSIEDDDALHSSESDEEVLAKEDS